MGKKPEIILERFLDQCDNIYILEKINIYRWFIIREIYNLFENQVGRDKKLLVNFYKNFLNIFNIIYSFFRRLLFFILDNAFYIYLKHQRDINNHDKIGILIPSGGSYHLSFLKDLFSSKKYDLVYIAGGINDRFWFFKNDNFYIRNLKFTKSSVHKNEISEIKKIIDIILPDENLFLKHKLFKIFLSYLNKPILASNYFKNMISKHKIKLILLWNDVLPLEKNIVLLSKKLGIPTVVFQHGIFYNNKDGFLPITADFFVSWGDLFTKLLISEGADSKKIKTMGNPKFDYLLGYIGKQANTLNTSNENKIRILYLPQPFEKYSKDGSAFKNQILVYLLKIIQRNPNYELVIKTHPGEKFFAYKRYKKIKNIKIFSKYSNLYDLIYNSDIVIGVSSTALLEAYILGKPTISIEINSKFLDFPFSTFGITYPCYNLEKLEDCIKYVLRNGNHAKNERLLKELITVDGHSKERIIEFLGRLILS